MDKQHISEIRRTTHAVRSIAIFLIGEFISFGVLLASFVVGSLGRDIGGWLIGGLVIYLLGTAVSVWLALEELGKSRFQNFCSACWAPYDVDTTDTNCFKCKTPYEEEN